MQQLWLSPTVECYITIKIFTLLRCRKILGSYKHIEKLVPSFNSKRMKVIITIIIITGTKEPTSKENTEYNDGNCLTLVFFFFIYSIKFIYFLSFNNDFYFFHYSWFTVFCQFSTIQQDDPVTHECIHYFFSHYYSPS